MNIIAIQPALPHYRLDFFRRVNANLKNRLAVFYSPTELEGITAYTNPEPWANKIGPIRSILPGLEWQHGAMSIPIRRGDVVVVCGAPRTVSTLFVIAKARLFGAKVLWWGHFWSSTSKTWRFHLRLKILLSCDGVIFYTDKEVDEYLELGNIKHIKNLTALNNGIDTAPISLVREDFDFGRREKALLFIGRITRKADLNIALDALAIIPHAMRPKLEVIGMGIEKDRLQARASELGLDGHVVWHGAITDETKIARIANRCRMFVYPGEVGLSLIHAMAYGLPALVPNNRWRHMPEIAAFEDGVTGFSFDRGSSTSLANAIVELINAEDVLLEQSQASLARVESTFNTRDMARRFSNFVACFT